MVRWATAALVVAGLLVAACATGPERPPEPSPVAPLPSVYWFVLDTARADVFRGIADQRPVHDGLDGLAADGITFQHVRAPTSWTRPSVATLLTGLEPTVHGVAGRTSALDEKYPMLQELLRRRGYATQAWSANPNVLPLWGFGRGFDHFHEVRPYDWKTAKADAREVFAAVRESLAQPSDRPGFYYVHLMDPHAPYRPPLRHVEALARGDEVDALYPARDADRSIVSNWHSWIAYVAEVRDVDAELGRFLDELREQGRYDDALVLVVSDHGEEFRDHGDVTHGRSLYEEVLRVPAVLKLPGNRRAGTSVATPVGLADLFAAVCSELDIPLPEGARGIDALDPAPRPPQVATLRLDGLRQTAVYDGGWKLIVDHKEATKELYELEVDPREQTDVAAREPDRVAALSALLDRLAAAYEPGWHVAACGCAEPTDLVVRAQAGPGGGTVVATDLEPADSLAGTGPVRLEASLRPVSARRESLGELVDVELPDRDGFAFVTPEGVARAPVLELEVATPGVGVALGKRAVQPVGEPVEIAAADASVAASEPIECRPPGSESVCEPYVRVWYVASPSETPSPELPPDVIERLEALGYQW